ncbi:hypothetical protein [Nocardioides sp. zg-1228]|uniref:hypothetical protein n=1 Tax=Nocardioides sp. zg-1228 TaxID=2763008 RepID=UPI001642BEA9|nr:hypothetical protein [Nocardioides sp. zg-1228]MBC2933855.1 hypothetical protein [Nocardioides sp. zg-1228]QSF58623.1 hypothetical protein JX575_05360 [Nocardioides sp. zg-1228]
MNRTSLSLAGGLATALLLVSTPAAQAAVGPKDALGKADIVKLFPELADGEFKTERTKKIAVPDGTCGANTQKKATSAVSIAGLSGAGDPIVVAGVAEVKSSGLAKTYFKAFTSYVKQCASYTDPASGATVTVRPTKGSKLGQESLSIVQETAISTFTTHSASVLIRDGKRIASIVVADDAPIDASTMKKLAKVAAKNMR